MKKRLDIALVEQGLVPSRERAKSIIMAGQVYVNGQKSDKAGTDVSAEDTIEIRGETLKYVSRGGLKLEKAMAQFHLDLTGKICCDIGASTGGFSDCMLQNGAVKVYAIDVGYGQLAWTLRNDPRVVNLERTNIRYVTEEQVPDPIDFISIDVSFISLTVHAWSAWSSPSLKRAKGKWAKKGWSRSRKSTWRSSKRWWDLQRKMASAQWRWTFPPSKGRKATSNTSSACKKGRGKTG